MRVLLVNPPLKTIAAHPASPNFLLTCLQSSRENPFLKPSLKLSLTSPSVVLVKTVLPPMFKRAMQDEASKGGELKGFALSLFMFLVKFVAPIAIAIVFLNGIGVLKF